MLRNLKKGFFSLLSILLLLFWSSPSYAAGEYSLKEDDLVIPYKVKTVSTDQLFKGESRVTCEGVNGLAMRTVIEGKKGKKTSETVLHVVKPPVTKVVEVGSKVRNLDTLPKDWRRGDEGLTSDTKKLRAILFHKFPEIDVIGGYRPCDFAGEHCSGRALDIMISGKKGHEVMQYLEGLHDEGIINICWNIYEQQFFPSPSFKGSKMSDRGSITQNHYDHIHTFLADKDGKCSKGER